MLARYHGINRIKDRYFLSSGLLLFLFLSAGTAVIFVRGEAKPPGAKARETEAESPETKAKAPEIPIKALEAKAKVPATKPEALDTQAKPSEAKAKMPAAKAGALEPQAKAAEVPTGEAQHLGARGSFFEMKFGTLAILPRAMTREAANRTGTFLIIRENASYTIGATHNPVWFQFNHHLSDSNGEPRHLGVLIIVHSKTVGSKRVEVYRNPGWTRQNRTEILGEFSKSPDLSWEQFAAISHKSGSPNANLQEVDDAFGGPWHAVPRGSDKYSWSYREFWDWAVSTYETTSKKALGSLPRPDRFRVSARLIAYVPTPISASNRPVVFSVNASQGDSVFLALYSYVDSGVDSQSWYWIQLK